MPASAEMATRWLAAGAAVGWRRCSQRELLASGSSATSTSTVTEWRGGRRLQRNRQHPAELLRRRDDRFDLSRGLGFAIIGLAQLDALAQEILHQRGEFQFGEKRARGAASGSCARIFSGSKSTATFLSIVTSCLLMRIVSRLFCSDSR